MTPTLLLADDSVTIQRIIELTFADENVRVVAVSDGEEAIAVLERTPPDIVLADVGMPGRSGYEVAQHIKDTPRLAHIPVVLLTGVFEPIDQAKAAAAGCDGVLAKPFEPQLVIGRVRELLSKPKSTPIDGVPLSPPPAAAWGRRIPAPEASNGNDTAETGDYFDRLDQAFASLSAQPGEASRSALDWFSQSPPDSAPTASLDPARPGHFDEGQSRQGAHDVDQATPVVPVSARSDPPPDVRPSYEPSSYGPPQPIPPGPDDAETRSAPPPTLPPLAAAFAALLAAEQAVPSQGAAPLWPLPPPTVPAAIGDGVIEEIVRRVLDELTERVVRESVAERVAPVAERLIREEIERIKASIK